MIRDTLLAAARRLLRTPRASALTIACIALGVAGSATALTLAWTLTFRPLPFPDADRFTRVWLASETSPRLDMSIPDVHDITREVTAFDAVAGTTRTRFVALFESHAVRLRGEAVTPGYFELLGVRPAMGRVLRRDDYAGGAPRVAVISHTTWRRYYAGAADVVGQSLRTERGVYEITGVLSPDFEGSIEHDVVEFWIPLSQYEPAALATDRNARQSWAIGRLARGQSMATANAQLRALGDALRAAHPNVYRGVRLRAEPFAENWRGALRTSGLLLLGAALVVLIIAVVNVSAMSLARAVDRRREFALRAALGAPHGRIVLLPFAESALAAVAGGVIGAALTPSAVALLLRVAPVQFPAYLEPRVSGVVVAFVMVVCVIAAAGAGLLPAREARRAALGESLRGGGRGNIGAGTPGRRRAGQVLVASQVALSMLLVSVAALLGRAYQSVHAVPLGFRTDVARFAVTASPSDLRDGTAALRARVIEAARAVDGVEFVGVAWPTLPPWDALRLPFVHAALGDVPIERAPTLAVHGVDADLFTTLGIALLAGRGVEPRDVRESSPVVVVSASLAERLGGAARVLDTELQVTDPDGDVPRVARIVGVASDVAWDGIGEQDTGRMIRWRDAGDPGARRYDVYYPVTQVANRSTLFSVAVRGPHNVNAALDPLTRAIAAAAPRSAVHWVSAMRDELAVEYRTATFAMFLAGAFALGALGLAATGLFALLAHAVARRVPEFGVRMALGASPARLQRDVIASGLRLGAAGACLGAVAALLVSRSLGQLLYDVAPADPAAFAFAAGALLTVAAVSSWLPARRASRVSAMEALRRE